MNKIIGSIKYQLPSILWAIFIYTLCVLTHPGLPSAPLFGFIPIDKLGHTFLFTLQLFFILWGFSRYFKSSVSFKKIAIWSFVITASYGLLIELIQHYFTATRTGDAFDFIADVVGCCLGILLYRFLKIRKQLSRDIIK